MIEALAVIEANWLVYTGVALAALVIAWWLLSRPGKGDRQREYQRDVLDEGMAPAARNQALIDAAPAAQVVMPPAMSDALGGMGELVARAAQDEVEKARAVELAPPPPPVPVPERQPHPEVIAEPAPMPGLDETASPDQTADEVQHPDSVSKALPEQAAAVPPASAAGDDLSRIKGLGPKLQMLLPTLGLNTYAQIATLTEADLVKLDAQLGPFAGRPARDGWVEQAKYLAAGDTAGFEARFGKV